jgi:hypothetical protein
LTPGGGIAFSEFFSDDIFNEFSRFGIKSLGVVAVARFRNALSGGTRTSVGEADQVMNELLKAPAGLTEIYGLFIDEDPVVAMRASYVAMRVAEQRPGSVKPFAKDLLKNLELYTQQEVRWHIPQLLVHLDLTKAQKRRAYDVIMDWAETDKSKIVGYYGFQAAADFAETDAQLLEDFIPRIRKANKTGAKSIQNRCKKIAKQLDIAL